MTADSGLLSVGQASLKIFVSNTLWKKKKFSYFGFANWSDNEDENFKLIELAKSETKKNGFDLLLGPLDGTTLGNYRYRLGDFERAPFYGEPNNTEKDVNRLYRSDFEVVEKYQSIFVDKTDSLVALTKPWLQFSKNLKFRLLNESDWLREYDYFPKLIHDIFSENPAYQILDEQQMKSLFHPQVYKNFCPRTSLLVYSQNRLVGFSFHFSTKNALYIKSSGIHPDFRERGQPFLRLISEAISRTRRDQKQIVACLMRRGNFPELLLRGLSIQKTEYGLFGITLS